jgi:putative ABC transport system permease protein
MQVATITDTPANNRIAFAITTFIDPAVYPFYDTIRAEDPPGQPLREIFAGDSNGNGVVIARRLATQLGAKLGDTLRLSNADFPHTLLAIVPDTAESIFSNPNALLFSFIYLDRAQMARYGYESMIADRAFLKFLPDTPAAELARYERRIRVEWPRSANGRGWAVNTAEETLRQNATAADILSRLVLIMSLAGLVIGGIGIINTMIVSVNRRSGEIAVLKTLGLKGGGVSLIFLTEALMLGFAGSLLGGVLGGLLSLVARNFGEQAFGIGFPLKLYPEAMLIGLVLGVVITLFFSLLPTLTAGQIRPALVLRQGAIPLARAGLLPSLISLLVLIFGFGRLVDAIIGDYAENLPLPNSLRFTTVGVLGVAACFFLLGLSLVGMRVVVWFLGKLPSFRNPNLRIAIRGLSQQRGRTALTLTVLVVGMGALSGTLIMTRTINLLLYDNFSKTIGGNVIVLPILPVSAFVNNALANTDGVRGYRNIRLPGSVNLISVDGDSSYMGTAYTNPAFAEQEGWEARLQIDLSVLRFPIGVNTYGNPARLPLVAGEYLTAEDAGKNLIVLPDSLAVQTLNIQVGSTLMYRFSGNDIQTFTVKGIVAPDPRASLIPFSFGDAAVQIPLDMMPQGAPFDFVVADADPAKINSVLAAAALPGTFVFDVTLFDTIISRILNQLAALPILIAILALVAASALIATTVSLSTLERRRQIGIMKAVGVKRRQTLWQLLIENGIVGFAGGIISLLPVLLILSAVPVATGGLVTLPVPVDLVLLMLLLSVGITVGATLLTAWGASGEKPLRVLRYE